MLGQSIEKYGKIKCKMDFLELFYKYKNESIIVLLFL